jgi:hypothetical protein
MVTRALLLAGLGAALLGCTPELDDRSFLVSGPRLLAIAASPAEAAPPAAVSFQALYVDASGARAAGELDWAYCVDRKPLTDDGTVSPSCVQASGDGLVPFGSGPSASGALPQDGCRLFGPDSPQAIGDQPAGRPVDPDPTGGFYQPVRLRVRDGGDTYAIGAARLTCGVGGATQDVAAELSHRYRLNESPAIASLTLVRKTGSVTVTPDASGAQVTRGEEVTLKVTWAACPTTSACGDGVCGIDEDVTGCAGDCAKPKGCTGAEQYVWFDPATRTVAERREAIRIDWFATAGTLGDDTSGRDESEAGSSEVGNTWTAPDKAGDARLWVVVRDDRGGVGWEGYRIAVE